MVLEVKGVKGIGKRTHDTTAPILADVGRVAALFSRWGRKRYDCRTGCRDWVVDGRLEYCVMERSRG